MWPYVVAVGGVALVGGTILGVFVWPQIEKLLGLKKEQKPIAKPNPNPAPNPGPAENPQQNMEPISYHSTRDIGIPRLTYRMSHSSTSYDRQSLEQRARDQRVVSQADLAREQSLLHYKRKSVSLSPPENMRLAGGVDGHGRVVKVPKRPERRFYAIKKAVKKRLYPV